LEIAILTLSIILFVVGIGVGSVLTTIIGIKMEMNKIKEEFTKMELEEE